MALAAKKDLQRRSRISTLKTQHLVQAANDTGLVVDQFKSELEQKAAQLFEEDLLMAKEWGVRGFPTIYFIDEEDNRFKVCGSKPYSVYEQALLKLLPVEVQKNKPSAYDVIFKQYDTVTLKEFAIFYDVDLAEAEHILNGLQEEGKVSGCFPMQAKCGM